VVESIARKRQPYTNLEAIYFISPTADSIDRLIADFQQRPLYAAANVFFTAGKCRCNLIIYNFYFCFILLYNSYYKICFNTISKQ